MGVGARFRVWGIPVGVFVAALVAYVCRLCRVVGPSDLGEFAVTPGFLAPGHYPGYPFLNQLFYIPHLIAGDPAFYAGLLNAIFAAAAVAVLWGVWRVVGVRAAVGAPLALAFALTPACWGTAAAGPEAFGLEALAAAVLIFLSFEAVSKNDPRFLLGAVLVFALSLGNRISFAMFAPLLVAVFLLTGRRGAAAAMAVFLIGVSVYIHYVLRNDYFGDQYGQNRLITGAQVYDELFKIWRYGFFTGGVGGGEVLSKNVLGGLIFQMKYGLLLFVVPGVAALIGRGRRWAVVAAALAAAAVGFLWAYVAYYGFPDEPYLIIPIGIIITFAALGAEWLTAGTAKRWRPGGVVVPALLFAIPLYFAAKNYGGADHTDDTCYDCFARELYKAMPREAAVLAEHHVLMPVVYYHAILACRPDAGVYSVGSDSWEEAPARLWAGELCYFGEIGSSRPRWTPERGAYLIDEWPGIGFRRGLRRLSVPGEFLTREVSSLPPGGRFCAVISDAVPVKATRREGFRKRRACCWRQTGFGFPLNRRCGFGVFLAGRKGKEGVRVYAEAKAGSYAGVFECPRKLAPPPEADVGFGWRGDAGRGFDELRLEIGEDLYSTAGSGIIFVPLTPGWRPAGEASYYSDNSLAPFYFYKVVQRRYFGTGQ